MAPPPPFGANSAAARDVANVLHPYTDLKAHLEVGPIVVSHGKGVRVWDDTGKDYIEGVAGLWCASLGFDNGRLVEAAAANGWIDRERAIAETLTAIKRAGASIVLTYWAAEVAANLH